MESKFVDRDFRALKEFKSLKEFKVWAEEILNYDEASPSYDILNRVKVILKEFPIITLVGLPDAYLDFLGLESILVTHKELDWRINNSPDPNSSIPVWKFEIL